MIEFRYDEIVGARSVTISQQQILRFAKDDKPKVG
jgi:hypothetical protein